MDYINYRDSYPNLENALKLGQTISICRSGKGLRIVNIRSDNEVITITRPHLSTALAYADQMLGQEEKKDSTPTQKASYPRSYDVFDMHIYKGRELTIFFALEKGTFVCVSTITDDLKDYLKYDVNCGYGTGDNLMSAITNLFISPHYQRKEHLADWDNLH
jgi:hypothetical protein